MASESHTAGRLSSYLDGAVSAAEAEEIGRHLASCAACAEERDLLREGRALVRPLPEAEPRPGFARRVALRAQERKPHPIGAPWWRWAFGGGFAVATAAAVVLAVLPRHAPERNHELVLAQRLELYEDLGVVQNQEALEDLDVVAVLHTLQPEGKP